MSSAAAYATMNRMNSECEIQMAPLLNASVHKDKDCKCRGSGLRMGRWRATLDDKIVLIDNMAGDGIRQ